MKDSLKKLIKHNPAVSLTLGAIKGAGAAKRKVDALRGRQVWAFNAGDHFTGNPKWLFIYVNRYRPEIDAYWVCDLPETVRYVKSLGYKAYTYGSVSGIRRQTITDVFCVEAVKEKLSPYFPKNMV